MQTDILLKRLQTFDFLRGLDQEALTLLAKNAMWKVFPADAVVFWEGIRKPIYIICNTDY